MRTPTWRELQKFCEVEGWYDRDARRGRPTGDHRRYGLRLPNGDVLTTKVSHGSGQIGADLFKRICRDQLRVTTKQFWAAVDTGVPPDREAAPGPPVGHRLPASLVEPLVRDFGVSDDELRSLSPEQARQLLREKRRQPRRG